MKTPLLAALLALATGVALPTFAQPKDAAGPRIVQQRDLLADTKAIDKFGDLYHKLEEAYNKNDAAAVVALFTEDAVLVTADGVFSGQQNIEKRYAEAFQRSPITYFVCSWERYHLNAIDNAAWSAGEWRSAFQSQTGPASAWGYWSALYIPDGDAWKIRLLTLTEYRPLPPRSTPTSQ
jgi:ketosteroid isomerase-like protein